MNTRLGAQFKTIQSIAVYHFSENLVVEETQGFRRATRKPIVLFLAFALSLMKSFPTTPPDSVVIRYIIARNNIDNNPFFYHDSRRVVIKAYAVFSSFMRSAENSRKSRSWEEPTNRRF